MAHLKKQDIARMDRAYLATLNHARLLGVAWELRELCVELWERLDQDSSSSSKPPSSEGVRISCSLHHYYAATRVCGRETKARPGEGYVSHLEGRKKSLKLTKYVLIDPFLATFFAALSNRPGMSRTKMKF